MGNLRGRDDSGFDQYGSPHNKFAYGFMKFHVKYKDPIDLYRKIKATVEVVKHSPAQVMQVKMVGAMMNMVPTSVIDRLTSQLAGNPTAMVSNVAGPQDIAEIAGYEIDDL